MIAAFVLDSSRMQYGIDRLALDLLNIRKVPTSDLIGKGSKQISMQKVDLQRIAAYASEDADVALRLADLLESRLAEIPTLKKLCDEVETPLIDVLVEMECQRHRHRSGHPQGAKPGAGHSHRGTAEENLRVGRLRVQSRFAQAACRRCCSTG